MSRLAVSIHGTVQGVGFRPFVHGAAIRRGLSGWVQNGTEGVRLEIQGPLEQLHAFVEALRVEAPPAARIERLVTTELAPREEAGFHILASTCEANRRPTLPADQAICADCVAEIELPGERRHRYPFTNCAHCGPRFTIIERLPYDRPNTAMARFELCDDCHREYTDPADRRFHAQPIACPACGPRLRWIAAAGDTLADGEAALAASAAALLAGRIVALQGLGGFQLLVDATSASAVARLRQRKCREEKPFAVMFPSLADVREACELHSDEEALLLSPAAPILLVRRRAGDALLAGNIAPGNPLLGALLPYTPLHWLLLGQVGRPLVCTSGNLSEEPLCTEESEARTRLADIADCFLVHDRPIVRPLDDSVARLGPTGPQVLRRARGHVPLPHPFLPGPCILALGGQLKATVTLAADGQAVVSQHLGDLSSPEAVLLLEHTVADLLTFLAARPEVIACDLHPDYASTRLAERLAREWSVPLERVQHHHAHVAAGMAEHQLTGPVLGLAWDGAGLGTDGHLWGGEALVVAGSVWRRVAHLRPFSLPGGERAIREPRRAALGLLFEMAGAAAAEGVAGLFSAAELSVLLGMLERRLLSPRTTSVGRLFDAVAALSGLRCRASFEGQAAMELEHAAAGVDDLAAYPLPLGPGEPAIADWEPMLRALRLDLEAGLSPGVISARFHHALAELAATIAARVSVRQVVLSGGCFQNLRLTSAVHQRLVANGFEVFLPERFPANDGGLSLGQAHVAALRGKEGPCASAFPVR